MSPLKTEDDHVVLLLFSFSFFLSSSPHCVGFPRAPSCIHWMDQNWIFTYYSMFLAAFLYVVVNNKHFCETDIQRTSCRKPGGVLCLEECLPNWHQNHFTGLNLEVLVRRRRTNGRERKREWIVRCARVYIASGLEREEKHPVTERS